MKRGFCDWFWKWELVDTAVNDLKKQVDKVALAQQLDPKSSPDQSDRRRSSIKMRPSLGAATNGL